MTLAPRDLANLTDPSAIREHLQRLSRTDLDIDPALVIGTAKELIESTVKLLLHDLGVEIEGHPTLDQLINRLHRALAADPAMVDPADDAAPAVKRILGGLKSLALGIGELRNKVGTGHGRVAGTSLSSNQLGRLAVDSAATYCGALLAMHAEHTNRSRW